ncbi:MAG: PA14 domain-containing protein [Bacteroidota bacterium]
MKNFYLSLLLVTLLVGGSIGQSYAQWTVSNQVDLFLPGNDFPDDGCATPRVLQLSNGNLIATHEVELPGGQAPYFPIYTSYNGGRSWLKLTDMKNYHVYSALELWQPELFEMPVTMGNIAQGTLLLSGVILDNNQISHIMVYKSPDLGLTWEVLSEVSKGNGPTWNIWEPNLIIDKSGRLLCFYADEREKNSFSQKLVYQASTNVGASWGPVVNTVAWNVQAPRPGMPRVTLMGDGRYSLVYEVIGEPGAPIYIKTSNDGFSWGSPQDRGNIIRSVDGATLAGSPSVCWTPTGSAKGTLIATANAQVPGSPRGTDNFVNYNYGVGEWFRVQQPIAYRRPFRPGYSRVVKPTNDGNTLLQINCPDYKDNPHLSKITFASTPAAFTPGLQYKLINRNSWLTLGLLGYATGDGTKANQWTDSYDDMQHWRIDDAGGGFFKLTNILANKALTASTTNNDVVITGGVNDAQLWQLINNNNGFYRLKNKATDKFLEIPNGSRQADLPVGQWADLPSPVQEWSIQYVNGFEGIKLPTRPQTTFLSSPATIPGTVQAENFDNGGEGVAYHDADAANKSEKLRIIDGPDIETCFESGGYNLDWSVAGEWTEYTVNVQLAGQYRIDTRVASPIGGSFHIEMDSVNVTGAIAVPNTGGWQTWQTVSKTVNLTAGIHVMRFFIDQAEFNTNSFNFVPLSGGGDGLKAQYFNGNNFQTPVLTRKDANINFNWGGGSPVAGVNTDGFSVRWTGEVMPRFNGTYTFHLTSDNGRRLWIGNVLVIDKWIDDWDVEYTATVNLNAGQRYDIQVDYFENVGGANAKLEWSGAGQVREVIPQSQLFAPFNTRIGVEELAVSAAALKLSPNPAQAQVQLGWEGADSKRVSIVSATGALVYQKDVKGMEQLTVSTSHLPTGIYIVSLQTDKTVSQKKLIITQ